MNASVQTIQERLGSNERPTEYPRKRETSAPGSGTDARKPGEETQVWKPEGNQAGGGKDGRQGSDRLAGLKQR